MILDIEMHTKVCERSFLYNYDETTQNWESWMSKHGRSNTPIGREETRNKGNYKEDSAFS